MAIGTVTMRNALCTAYATNAPYCTLTSTAPSGAVAGTELVGITRQPSNWGSPAASAVTSAPAAFSIASGQTVAGVQYMSASTAGTFLDGVGLTGQTFSSAGTYTVTVTYTQS